MNDEVLVVFRPHVDILSPSKLQKAFSKDRVDPREVQCVKPNSENWKRVSRISRSASASCRVSGTRYRTSSFRLHEITQQTSEIFRSSQMFKVSLLGLFVVRFMTPGFGSAHVNTECAGQTSDTLMFNDGCLCSSLLERQ